MKRKSTVAILMASVMMLGLVGCGNVSIDSTPETTESTVTESDANTENETTEVATNSESDAKESADTAATGSDATFEYNGKTINFTDDVQTVIEALKTVATSDGEIECDDGSHVYNFDLFEGNQEDNLIISTFDDGGKEKIGKVDVLYSGITTSKGISIGSKEADVTAAYGEPSEKDKFGETEAYMYKFDDVIITFEVTEGEVCVVRYSNPNFKG